MSFGVDSIMVDTLLRLKQIFEYDIFVETGTGKGLTLKTLHPFFNKLYSCEIRKDLWIHYDELITNKKITIELGTSQKYLPIFFKEINHDKFFLYLDAHNLNSFPILDELKIVSDFGYTPIIIIHDFDNNMGFSYIREQNLITEKTIYGNSITKQALNFECVKESIENIYGKGCYQFEVNDNAESKNFKVGCAYFYPKK